MALSIVEKNKIYQKIHLETIRKSMKFNIELQKTGQWSSSSLAEHEKIKGLLLKAKNILFKKYGEYREIDFLLDKYEKGLYNKEYIISIDSFYFNIWRKTGNGFFSLPLQFPSYDFSDTTNYISNPYLLDIAWVKPNIFYDVSMDEAFVSFIDSQFKSSRKGLSSFIKDYNKLVSDFF